MLANDYLPKYFAHLETNFPFLGKGELETSLGLFHARSGRDWIDIGGDLRFRHSSATCWTNRFLRGGSHLFYTRWDKNMNNGLCYMYIIPQQPVLEKSRGHLKKPAGSHVGSQNGIPCLIPKRDPARDPVGFIACGLS